MTTDPVALLCTAAAVSRGEAELEYRPEGGSTAPKGGGRNRRWYEGKGVAQKWVGEGDAWWP